MSINNNNRGKTKKKYVDSGTEFVNPYNFVPVAGRYEKRRTNIIDNSDTRRLSGVINCLLSIKTPIAIPDVDTVESENVEDSEHKIYEFFSVEGEPIIPGSSIRGVIRNVYETVTNSCFSTMKDTEFLTSRTTPKNVFNKAGLLRRIDGKWKLYPADLWRIESNRTKGRKDEGWHKFSKSPVQEKKGTPLAMFDDNAGIDGYLYFGGDIGNKKHRYIFIENKKPPVEVSNEEMIGLDKVIYDYLSGKNSKAYESYEKQKKEGCIPIYYNVKDNRRYLSPAMIGRMAFKTSLNTFIGEINAPNMCRKNNNVCPACNLFGFIGDSSKNSKVRITDAKGLAGTISMKRKVTFDELSSPKPSYFLFYLDGHGNINDGFDSTELEIRGRKFYWHNKNYINQRPERGPRNATFDVVDRGVFAFDVYFEGITEKQLKELLWTLTLGENIQGGKKCHKIGHGKPLGYGSVKITVSDCIIKSFNFEEGLKEEHVHLDDCLREDDYIPNVDKKVLKSLLTITDFDAVNDRNVTYPRIEPKDSLKINEVAAHKWFFENKREMKKLPDVLDISEKRIKDFEYKREETVAGTDRCGQNSHNGNGHAAHKNSRRDNNRRSSNDRNGDNHRHDKKNRGI